MRRMSLCDDADEYIDAWEAAQDLRRDVPYEPSHEDLEQERRDQIGDELLRRGGVS